jgi:hypothetical protein
MITFIFGDFWRKFESISPFLGEHILKIVTLVHAHHAVRTKQQMARMVMTIFLRVTLHGHNRSQQLPPPSLIFKGL